MPVIGWIITILVAILMLYAADAVIYVVTWMVSYIDAAFSPLGIHIEVFEYLDILYPYFRSAVQIMAVGIAVVAVFHIVTSIRERT